RDANCDLRPCQGRINAAPRAPRGDARRCARAPPRCSVRLAVITLFDRAVAKGTRFARGEDKTPAGDYSGSPTRCRSTWGLLVPNMCVRLLTVLFVIVAFAGTARAQNFPPGSYQRHCKQVHWAGRTLVAECQRADGRYSGTGLADAAHCHGDIANI